MLYLRVLNINTLLNLFDGTAQNMKFPIKDIFSKCDQIRNKLWILSHFVQCRILNISRFQNMPGF